MPNAPDTRNLLQNQYKDAWRLDARIQLHAEYSTNKQGFYTWVFEQLRLPPACHVLEVGCGSGRLWLENSHRIPADWDITLSDLSAGMLGEAQRLLSECRHSWQFVVHDAQSLPFADHCFDALIANHMLYHVPHRVAAYSEFRRVLKPSGRLYASTNSRDTMRELNELVHRFQPAPSQGNATANLINDRRLSTGFNLENGASELTQWFASVTLHRYDDALVIPEAEPLVAYVKAAGYLADDWIPMFKQHVEELIRRDGPIHISKGVGIFEAYRHDPG